MDEPKRRKVLQWHPAVYAGFQNVLELLEDCGKIPDELRKRVLSERNLEVLVRWLKLAARTGSVEEFQSAM